MPAKSSDKARRKPRAGRFPVWLAALAALLLAAGFFSQRFALVSDQQTAALPSSPVRISEIMASNKSSVKDGFGKYPDWVELVNESASPTDVTGWKLTDGKERLVGFTFPAQTLAPGERVVIYCSGDLKTVAGYDYHAPFRLSAQGESVMLYNSDGALADSVTYPALRGNEVYAKGDSTGEWSKTTLYTPGLPNDDSSHEKYVSSKGAVTGEVIISEVMSDNYTYEKSQSGYCDWIELYNTTNKSVSLAGWTLTDDSDKPDKWVFPANASINAGEYLIVYASGLNAVSAGEVHANFKISSKGETISLYDASSAPMDSVTVPVLDPDTSYSRRDGGFTSQYPPTPAYPNDQSGVNAVSKAVDARNTTGVYINEAISSARVYNSADSVFDWIELYNSTGAAVDLSGYSLTDATAKPRKWVFPQGSSIAAGEYLVIYASGADKANASKGSFHTNFKLSLTTGETLALFAPSGELVDRLPLAGQVAGVSFGRPASKDGQYYLSTPTRGAANESEYFEGRASKVEFGAAGGFFTEGSVTVSLSAEPNLTIRYTLDSSEPTIQSSEYTAPFSVSQTTIVRAKAFGSNLLPSNTYTQSYIFDEAHTLPVVSIVADDSYLFGAEMGIYSVGPVQLKYPFKGANFFKNWERGGNVELFSPGGKTLVSQGVGLKLQGQYSRMQNQKSFKVIARRLYGDYNRFSGKLFPNRDYTSYKSFILRASGQDAEYTRMRDSVITSLSSGLGVMYQDYVPVVVYVNGQYWGHYNMRERVHKYSIAQWEGWSDPDDMDIVKGNSGVMQGSNKEYAEFLTWLSKNGCKSEANMARVEQTVDVDNYLTYVAIEMYIGNTDLLNVKRYRSDQGDGKWRWILYDTDWAFNVDTDSYRRWLNKDGAGSGKKTDNTLFVQLMKNADARSRFFTILGRVMYDNYRSDIALAKIDEFTDILKGEMPRQVAKWGGTVKDWGVKVKALKAYANSRAKKLLTYIKSDTGWTNAQMREYFADIMDSLGV